MGGGGALHGEVAGEFEAVAVGGFDGSFERSGDLAGWGAAVAGEGEEGVVAGGEEDAVADEVSGEIGTWDFSIQNPEAAGFAAWVEGSDFGL